MGLINNLTSLLHRAVGYDHLPLLFDLVMERERSSVPRYDVERDGVNEYRITLELPGFSKDDIDIVHEPGLLAVRGRSTSLTAKDCLYRGIDRSEFERVFDIADHIEVTGAIMSNGLLVISLKREIPEVYRPRRISIRSNSLMGAGRSRVADIVDHIAHHAMRIRRGLEQLFQTAMRILVAGGTREHEPCTHLFVTTGRLPPGAANIGNYHWLPTSTRRHTHAVPAGFLDDPPAVFISGGRFGFWNWKRLAAAGLNLGRKSSA